MPITLYDAETWSMAVAEKNEVEISCLRSVYGE